MGEKIINAGLLLFVGFIMGGVTAHWRSSLNEAELKVAKANEFAIESSNSLFTASEKEATLSAHLNQIAVKYNNISAEVDKQLNQSFELKGAANAKIKRTNGVESKVVNVDTCAPAVINGDSYMPFNIGTVRLLNAARTGTSIDSVSISDAESATPANVTVRVFVANDTEIAKMYNELAERHNLLVDQVTNYQKKQKERIGLRNE